MSGKLWEYELKERDLAQLSERFEQWAENIGALRQLSSKLSLDHRLRDSPTVRASIFSMLEDLNDSAKTDIVSGRRPNRVMPRLDISEEELEEFDISSNISESGASTTSNSSRESRHGATSEIHKLLSAIRTSLNTLFKASVFIRKFAPEDRRQRASKAKPFASTADLMYIKDKGECSAKTVLQISSATSEKLSSQQDDGIMVRKDAHLRTQSKPLEKEPHREGSIISGMTKTSILAETEATEFVRNKTAEAHFSGLSSPEPAMSVFSMATTVEEASDAELQFPPIPQEGQKSDSFLCSFCLEIVLWQTKNKEAHTWFEHELLVHRTIWECPLCANTVQDSEDMKKHLHSYHGSDVVASQLPSLSGQYKRPARHILASECPFCDDEWAKVEPDVESSVHSDSEEEFEDADVYVDADEFRRHVGHHLVQLSLFSLPRLYSGDFEGLNSAGAVPDGERYSEEGAPFRLGKDHLSRGWQVVMKRMGTLSVISLSLGFHDMQKRGKVIDIKSRIFVQTLVGHDQDVYRLDVSNNGKLLASGSGDYTVRLWSTTTWECLHTVELPAVVTGLAFSNQNDFLAVYTLDNVARVWETDAIPDVKELSEEIQAKPNIWTCYGHSDSVDNVRFSSDDRYVITASSDKTAKVFPAASQQCDGSSKSLRCLSTLEGHSDGVVALAVMSNGWALTTSSDSSVRFLDIKTGRSIARLNAQRYSVL
ncbi:hypothetical protein BDP81DRAFT_510114 [Colletotrichum phormii]|uniref:C2H2-type domain-containing protein n=1 Tax=Colletotrichum phormii TaxID=359342 RepID=A0AAI9ZYX1_9PEZI|nr:uncharacterized protein BDP81DRAFT_510114 [Colletotrichum phormii]KAK1640771.1 hypothetical protein BDP81DRAFT_510114 [Colletotrichum phormii]